MLFDKYGKEIELGVNCYYVNDVSRIMRGIIIGIDYKNYSVAIRAEDQTIVLVYIDTDDVIMTKDEFEIPDPDFV